MSAIKAEGATKKAALPAEDLPAPGPVLDEVDPIPVDETIVSLLALAGQQVGPIGKDDKAPDSMGGFAFRGIERIMREVGPVFHELGIVSVPKVLAHQVEDRAVGQKTWRLVTLTVQYAFYGPHGDRILAVTVGEGLDGGDKASNKALTSAWKYALIQVLGIADGDDVEAHAPPDTTKRYESVYDAIADQHGRVHAEAVRKVVASFEQVPESERGKVKAKFVEVWGRPYDLDPALVADAQTWLDDEVEFARAAVQNDGSVGGGER